MKVTFLSQTYLKHTIRLKTYIHTCALYNLLLLSLHSSFTLTSLFCHYHSTFLSLSLYSSFTLNVFFFNSHSTPSLALSSFFTNSTLLSLTLLFFHSHSTLPLFALHSSFTHSTLLSLTPLFHFSLFLHSYSTVTPLLLHSYYTLTSLLLHSFSLPLHSNWFRVECCA